MITGVHTEAAFSDVCAEITEKLPILLPVNGRYTIHPKSCLLGRSGLHLNLEHISFIGKLFGMGARSSLRLECPLCR